MVIEKNAKKKFFRKTWLTEKLKYTENREFSKTFFPYSFLKFNYLQAHIKKIKVFAYVDTSSSEAYS
jgi:hypothetical protein